MIYPRKWIRWRPGFLIPVFFLASSQLTGQGSWPYAETAALGRCYATRSGHASAGLNQAGLGRTDKSTCSLHHSRPFITSDLDIVSLSLKLALKWGGPGLCPFHYGNHWHAADICMDLLRPDAPSPPLRRGWDTPAEYQCLRGYLPPNGGRVCTGTTVQGK